MKVYLTPEEVERMAQAATCLRDGLLLFFAPEKEKGGERCRGY
jgi:hypothetical protein